MVYGSVFVQCLGSFVCVCVYQIELVWAFIATCFPVLFSGLVKERGLVLMFGCYTQMVRICGRGQAFST
jgi:hypothetical protein